jgi:hypothetical protein
MTAGEVDGYGGREELEVDAKAAFARDGRRASDDKMIQNIKLNEFSAPSIAELVEKLRRICQSSRNTTYFVAQLTPKGSATEHFAP